MVYLCEGHLRVNLNSVEQLNGINGCADLYTLFFYFFIFADNAIGAKCLLPFTESSYLCDAVMEQHNRKLE